MVRVERIELSSRPWEGRILATIRYPLVQFTDTLMIQTELNHCNLNRNYG